MSTDYLTALPRFLQSATSRRGLLAGLAASALAISPDGITAKKKRKRKKGNKRKNKDRPQDLPQIQPDAQCAGANGAAVDSTPDGRIAQTFTAIGSGALVRAELEFVKPTGSLGDYILQLAPVDGFGFPTNEVLATVSLPSAQVPDGFPTVGMFTFPQPTSVEAGVQYALVLSRPEVGIVGWLGRLDNGCGGRAFSSEDRTGPFVGVGQNVDLVFTTFVVS